MAVKNLIRLNANLTPQQLKLLDSLAEYWECSRSEALRRCLEEGLRWSGFQASDEIKRSGWVPKAKPVSKRSPGVDAID